MVGSVVLVSENSALHISIVWGWRAMVCSGWSGYCDFCLEL